MDGETLDSISDLRFTSMKAKPYVGRGPTGGLSTVESFKDRKRKSFRRSQSSFRAKRTSLVMALEKKRKVLEEERENLFKTAIEGGKRIVSPINSLDSTRRLFAVLESITLGRMVTSTEKSFVSNVRPEMLEQVSNYFWSTIYSLENEKEELGTRDEVTENLFRQLELASRTWQAIIEGVPSIALLLAKIKQAYDMKVIAHVSAEEKRIIHDAQQALEKQAQRGLADFKSTVQLFPEEDPTVTIQESEQPEEQEIHIEHDSNNRAVFQQGIVRNLVVPRKPSVAKGSRLASPRMSVVQDVEEKRTGEHVRIRQHVKSVKEEICSVSRKSSVPDQVIMWVGEALRQLEKRRDMHALVFPETYTILVVCMNTLLESVTASNKRVGEACFQLWILLLRLFDGVSDIRRQQKDWREKEETRLLHIQAKLDKGLSTTVKKHSDLLQNTKVEIEAEIQELNQVSRVMQSSLDFQKMKVLVLENDIKALKQRELQLKRKTITMMNRRVVQNIVVLAKKSETEAKQREKVQARLESELEKHKVLQEEAAKVFFDQTEHNVRQVYLQERSKAEEAEREATLRDQEQEAERKEAAELIRRRAVLSRAEDVFEEIFSSLHTLDNQLFGQLQRRTRDACVQATESDFEITPSVTGIQRKVWARVKGAWVLRRNNELAKVNPYIPAEFIPFLKAVQASYKPKRVPIRTVRKLVCQVYLEDFAIIKGTLATTSESAGKSSGGAAARRRKNGAMRRDGKSQAALPSSQQQETFGEDEKRDGDEEEEEGIGREDSDASAVGQVFRKTVHDFFASKYGAPAISQQKLLDFIDSILNMEEPCMWTAIFCDFLQLQKSKQNKVDLVDAGEDKSTFEGGSMHEKHQCFEEVQGLRFFESTYHFLCYEDGTSRVGSVVEEKETGQQFTLAVTFERCSQVMLESVLTEEEVQRFIQLVKQDHMELIKGNDKKYLVPKKLSSGKLEVVPVEVAAEKMVKKWFVAKIRLMDKLRALFLAADYNTEGILTFTQFTSAVRGANPNLSQHKVGKLYRAALKAGSNSETVQREDFVQAGYRFALLCPREWEKADIGLSKFSREDGVRKDCDVDDIDKLVNVWTSQKIVSEIYIADLGNKASSLVIQMETVQLKQRVKHVDALLQRVQDASNSGDKVLREAAWMAMWLLRYELEKTQRTKEVSAALGSVQFLMRWKIRMRKFIGADGSVFRSKNSTFSSKTRPKLHPIFSKCRWHRASEFIKLLDGDETTPPFPINEVDDCQNSLLHIAVQNGHDDFVQLLIERGIDLNLQNMTGQTAMHFAKFYGHKRIHFMLRRAGADETIANNAGVTVLDAAPSK